MAGNVQSKYLKKIFFGVMTKKSQKNPKKFFSLFLGSPCRETPKNAIKKIQKNRLRLTHLEWVGGSSPGAAPESQVWLASGRDP